MKLNIGSRERAEGWKTFDINPGPEVDYVGDCRDLSRFADNAIDTIYASHVLEHVPYHKVLQATLREWFRVLAPGGTVMISVPDFALLCRLFLQPEISVRERFHIMRIIFGGQLDQYDFHAVGLTFEFLNDYLSEVGFADIRRVDRLGLFKDGSEVTVGEVAISLNVVARKPENSGHALSVSTPATSFLRRGG